MRLGQCTHHPDVVRSQGCTTRQQEGGPAKRVPGFPEKCHLLGVGNVVRFDYTEKLQGTHNLGIILLNQQLGTRPQMRVQLRSAHAAHVAMKPRTQIVHDATHILCVHQGPQPAEVVANAFRIIIRRIRSNAPFVLAFQHVELLRGCVPFTIGAGVHHDLRQLLPASQVRVTHAVLKRRPRCIHQPHDRTGHGASDKYKRV